jgi:signal transduction histidine kinase/DNA-binding response OmpR family regulator
LGYSTSGTNQLQYKLEGFDKEWYTTDSNNPVATYTNLKPGSYTFSVKSSNYQGEWNGKTKSIRVQIHPPFWKSTWAYILYIIVTSGLIIYSIYRFRKRMIDKQKLQFERLESEKEKELYHAKIDFFTNIAHEIRTPLTLIKGPLENILKKNDLNEKEVKENLNIMEQNTLRLLNLTNQLLDFRKTETKGFSLNFMTYNISEILKETYNRFLPTAKQNYLEFNLQLPEKDFYAPVDKEALTKILSNLFNNAVKYAQSNIIVQLDIQPEDNPNMFMITVSNDGTLIPKDMEEDIFKPFVQIKNTDNGQRTAGTGIGLPLARSLAELHKGKLYLKNEDQICFCVELPITQENVIQLSKHYIEDSPNIPDRHLATTPENQNTILVIDDDPEILSFVSKQLQNTYKIITATNGKEALDILETESVNLIVSDVMMPEIDGFELCKRLKNNINYSHIPIILLTARATLQSKIEGIELGADAYIEKPFSTEYLLVKIATLLTNLEKLRKAFTSSPFVEARTIALSNADEKFLDKLTETIKKNISEPEFNVDILASEMNMSRSSLHRKIKSIAQITPNEYIQLERLKTAAQLLQSGNYKINEICYIVGFNSSSYFAKCFQKQFGVLPKEFCSSIRN